MHSRGIILSFLLSAAVVMGNSFTLNFSASGFQGLDNMPQDDMRWALVFNLSGDNDFTALDTAVTEDFKYDESGQLIGDTDLLYVFGDRGIGLTTKTAPPFGSLSGTITTMANVNDSHLANDLYFAIIWFPEVNEALSNLTGVNRFGYLTSDEFRLPSSGSESNHVGAAVFADMSNRTPTATVHPAVPEPATYALLLAAGIALVAVVRRRIR